MRILFLTILLLISACAGVPETDAPLTLRPAEFSDLPGWKNDKQGEALGAILRSCARIAKKDPAAQFGPISEAGTFADWQEPCGKALALNVLDDIAVREFLETYFQPYEARAGNTAQGLFTGYYEASLRGSRTRQGPYQVPLYGRPADLVMVDLGEFREELKGQRIAGRVKEGSLKPYEDRAQIVAGAWPHNDQTLVWVDNAVDAFYVQIQGSGVVQLDDGSAMRIGYAGQNGHVYTAIGKELIVRGHLTKDNVSMQAIRDWLANNPAEAAEVMNVNKSYVFFKELTGEGPIGGENVALTPGRSLAIDRSKIPYGVPIWVDIESPVEGTPDLRRLMVAQDTGGAIRGAVRGDYFWGYGARAEEMAGPMKSEGRYWLLLPRNQ